MSKRIINNRGVYNENQSNSSGSTVYNAGHDINVNQNIKGSSLHEFQELLGHIDSNLKTINLPKSDQVDIEAIISQVLKQSQREKPDPSLVVGPLHTALELIKQAGGAAVAVTTIAQLIQKAIAYAKTLF